MKRVLVRPFRGKLEGTVFCPRDKSLSHRAAFIGALSEGETVITGFSFCRDCLATLSCLRALGPEILSFPEEGKVVIRSGGLSSLREPEDVLNAENSGTTIRLMAGIASGIEGLTVLTGDESLRKRPMRRIVEPLKKAGVEIGGRNGDRFPPLFIRGRGKISPVYHVLEVPSAQVKSALIFAALRGEGKSVIVEPLPSRNHTENMLSYVGVTLYKEGKSIVVEPPQKLGALPFHLPGDMSSAAFLMSLALCLPHAHLVIKDVGLNPTRTGFLSCLERMGGKYRILSQWETFGELRGDIETEASELSATSIGPEEIPLLIDEIPILSVLAARAQGTTTISGAGELRVKESDRLRAIAQGLTALGVRVEEKEDGLVIHGPSNFRWGVVQSFGDHRIAMSFVVAGLLSEEGVVVEDVDCVDVSYPTFFSDLEKLGIQSMVFEES
ncbi:MAG: 3-phosphoshikimate 1-carboxyvinyltransferase [Candidatus Caldatribacteriaceae bacterium]